MYTDIYTYIWQVIAGRFPAQLEGYMRDVVDLLVGWSLDPLVYAHAHRCIYVYAHAYVCMYVGWSLDPLVYAHAHRCIYVYAHAYVCMYVCRLEP